MSSAKNVAARALHRVRSPARLNAVVELNKALKEYTKGHKRTQELHNRALFYETPGVHIRRNIFPKSNRNVSYWHHHQRYINHLYAMHNLGKKVNTLAKRVERAFPYYVKNIEEMPVNRLQNLVNRLKKVTASHVIARRIERAWIDPNTPLGQRRLLREFNKLKMQKH